MKRATFITWEQLKVGGMILLALGDPHRRRLQARRSGEPVLQALSARRPAAERERVARGRHGHGGGPVGRHRRGDRFSPARRRHDAEPERRRGRRPGAAAAGARGFPRPAAHVRPPGRQDRGHLARDAAVCGPAANDTIQVAPALDYEAVLIQASGAVNDMVQLTRDLKGITGGMARGEGNGWPAADESVPVRRIERNPRTHERARDPAAGA